MAAHQCHLAHNHVLLDPNSVLKIENKKKKKKEYFTKKIQIPSRSLESRGSVTRSPHSYTSAVSAAVWDWAEAA